MFYKEIKEKYKIDDKDLKWIYKSFNLTKDKEIKTSLLNELVKVIITPLDKDKTVNQEGLSWLRFDLKPITVPYGEKVWITKSEKKVIERMAIKVSVDRGSYKKDNRVITNTSSVKPRFDITEIISFKELRKG